MTPKVNKQAVAQAFGRAAQSYNHHAELQRLCGERLMSLSEVSGYRSVLDAGCGTGWFSQRWRDRGLQVTALDLSPAMLAEAQSRAAAHHYLSGDIDDLPLPDGAVDLCWSNLAVQWCDDLQHALNQLCRVTRTGGKVMFSTLAADSLSEVRDAWRQLDGASHVNNFLSIGQIAAAGAGKNMQLSEQHLTLAFPDVLAAMRSLKGIGATHLHQGRSAGLMTRQRLQQLEQCWSRDQRGCLLSYHLVFGVISL
ncbi:malonyl-ACP O-methyltransferase BioC [Erwiniaceae bacterium BAC15a-03b]|uniref:Malonyl-[acyl-carrier protein] O-methyltransferase n=1 Tax=Winslowiella arboricola TaxID=2978220 RepID=A0A9J6PJC2_9GAMM|nr:malonyl-ACP O-methyltransferase BioC [Winslowiella arboricola]MCU5774245.1 malonyl-ACP O-methyltransferase BioC [Winslowiella arboricola]MCU5776822.1 malonyl-ACP O-methyltransferase BioC [Winslowiella arboricola]